MLCSCKTEDDVLFRWDFIKNNGFEWKTYGNSETHPKYKGEISNGMPNGKGKLTYPDGSIYEGTWIEGQRHVKRIENYTERSTNINKSKKGKKLKKKLLSGISPLSE